MDSLPAGRYAEAMRRPDVIFILSAAMSFVSAGPLKAQAEHSPVLAVLEYSGGLLPKRAEIHATRGTAKSPYPNGMKTVWVLREGTTLKQKDIPNEHVIHFLRSTENATEVVGSVVVRYVQTQKGWRPSYFLLQQLPPVVWNGERLVPLSNVSSSRETLYVINKNASNTGGFYQSLSFGFISGPSHIDGWTVE